MSRDRPLALVLATIALGTISGAGCQETCTQQCQCGEVQVVNGQVRRGMNYTEVNPLGGECLDCEARCQEACGACAAIECASMYESCRCLNQVCQEYWGCELAEVAEVVYMDARRVRSVDGLLAVLTDTTLSLFDASTPEAIQEAGFLALTEEVRPEFLDTAPGRAYLSGPEYGLAVVDLTDPAQPVLAGRLPLTGMVGGPRAAGDLVYLPTDAGLQILDVTDPAAITLRGELAVGLRCCSAGLAVADGVAFLQLADGDLLCADVSDPTAPAEVGRLPWTQLLGYGPAIHGLAAEAGLLVQADSDGLRVIQVGDPSAPALLGELPYPGQGAQAVVLAGGRAHAIAGGQLVALDLGDPAAPQERGRSLELDLPLDLAPSGDLVVVAVPGHGLEFLTLGCD